MVGEVRRTISLGRQSLGLVKQLGLDFLGNPAFSEVLPPKALRAAAGVRFNAVMGNGSTFLAPITAFPTTTLTMALWNSEPDGGKSYFIDRLYSFLASGTPGAGGCLLACVTKERQTAPTLSTGDNLGYANTKIGGLSGKSAGASKAVFINAITALSAPAWFVAEAEPSAGTGATIATHAVTAELQGGVVVPPGYMLGLAYLSAAGTSPLYGFGVVWDEIQADLE
jgi:hypothetical protein